MNFRKFFALLLVLSLCAALFSGCTGGFDPADYGVNDVTILENYAVTEADPEDDAMSAIIAIDGNKEPLLTNREFQIYYWLEFYDFMNYYGSYASYFGLDFTTPLAGQTSMVENRSWEQYFLESATQHYTENYALSQLALSNGHTLSEEDEAQIADISDPEGEFAKSAAENGYESSLAYLQMNFGEGTDIAAYQSYLRTYYTAYDYYNEQAELIEASATDEAIEEYYLANEASYVEKRLLNVNNVTVRHILITPEEKDESGNFTEGALTLARKQIDSIYADWQTNPTEDYFAQLATENSADTGSVETGGLYEDFDSDDMVEAFAEWCFDQSRQPGDTGIVETEHGYHLIYFVEQTETRGWMETVREDMVYEQMDAMVAEAVELYPVYFDYSKVVIFDMITMAAEAEAESGSSEDPEASG